MSAWLVRRCEGIRRNTFGVFVDQTRKPIIKGTDRNLLDRVAEAHNTSQESNEDYIDRLRARLQKHDGCSRFSVNDFNLLNERQS